LSLDVKIVNAVPSHLRLVYHSWIREYRKVVYPDADPNWLAAAQHCLIDRLLAAKTVLCAIAVDPENPDNIRGYLAGDPDRRLMFWLYVRGKFRQARVATRLLEQVFERPEEPIEVTVTTRRLNWLRRRWTFHKAAGRLSEVIR
jgi:hypothetical protein